MAKTVIFDQRKQKVKYQFNAAGNINIGAVQNRGQAISQLEELLTEFGEAAQKGAIPEDIVPDAEYQLKKALQIAKRPGADKKTILDHLNRAKSFIENVAATGGLVAALIKAGEMVQKFF